MHKSSAEVFLCCGIDVSAAQLVVALEGEDGRWRQRSFPNRASGHQALILWLQKSEAPVRVCLEATGLYSLDLALALHAAAEIEVAVLVETRDQIIQDMSALKTRPVGSSVTRIVVFFTDAAGNVTSYKDGVLDANSPVTRLVDFYWPDAPQPGQWPVLRVISWSYYQGNGWFGGVRWTAKLDTSTMSVLERVPLAIQKTTQDGSGTSDITTAQRTSPTQIQIKAGISGAVILYPCPDLCIVDGPTLLSNW